MNTQPSAKIIADSVNEQGQRLTTMEVVMHRFVLAEFNTHRVFSRNSASSRAIPYQKICDRVQANPAYPLYWGKEQKGMQSGSEFTESEIPVLREDWHNASVEALNTAELLHKSGVHKSLVNRLLEPFMWHTAIVSSTEWNNFFHQRCSPLAQPEIRVLAEEMQKALYTSQPKELAHGQWHLPYIQPQDIMQIEKDNEQTTQLYRMGLLKNISVARCARVSYLTHDGKRDLSLDIELAEKLIGSGHWSPFEHVATPSQATQFRSNFEGWKQYRSEFRNNNHRDFVPLEGGQ